MEQNGKLTNDLWEITAENSFLEQGNYYELVVRALESEASSCSGRVKSVYFLSQRCGLIDSFAGSAASNSMACFSLFCGNNRMLWPTTEMRNLAFMFDRARFFWRSHPKYFAFLAPFNIMLKHLVQKSGPHCPK